MSYAEQSASYVKWRWHEIPNVDVKLEAKWSSLRCNRCGWLLQGVLCQVCG